MAALDYDFPWIDSMSPSSHHNHHHHHHRNGNGNGSQPDPHPPTVAAFSPTTLSGSSLTSKHRSSVIVHRKSPLLIATPPEVTRALAYSHPFILPFNTLAGLLTWSTGDPWQSFLFLAGYWTVVLYSDAVILWAGPVVVVVGLILGLYSRRQSPLSSTVSAGEKHGSDKAVSRLATRQHKSLDEIVETMRTFTTRCNILLGPFLELTDFLSTQMTASSTTARPPLAALIIRIIFATPVWILLSLPPINLITTRRVVAIVGTIFISYHSRPARVARVMLWRSLTVRRICSMITGLKFSSDDLGDKSFKLHSYDHFADLAAKRRGESSGIRFTFVLYENQRRWLGIGWTYSLLPTERAPWTDELLNPVPPKDEFELPDVLSGNATWRWVQGSDWCVEGADDSKPDANVPGNGGWAYSDNKWNDPRPGKDGWDRYTRRRKWFRTAELVEVTPTTEATAKAPSSLALALREQGFNSSNHDASASSSRTASPTPSAKRRKKLWFSSSKGESEKTSKPSTPSASKNSSVDLPRMNNTTTTTTSGSQSEQKPACSSKPINIVQTGKSSNNNNSPKTSSIGGSLEKGNNSIHGGDSMSLRDKEIIQAQDHVDHWGTRATGGMERAEREMGLGDDVNMSLS